MLIAFASHKTRMAIAASPDPRKTALIMKSMTTVAFPASMTLVNPAPLATTEGEAPINESNFGARGAPMRAMIAETMSASTIA